MVAPAKSTHEQWLDTLPLHLRLVAVKYPPTRLYRHRITKQFVAIQSYEDRGTDAPPVLCILIFGVPPHGGFTFEGIAPDELETIDERAEQPPADRIELARFLRRQRNGGRRPDGSEA